MADKYLALVGGQERQVEGQVTGGGVGQAGKLVALDNTGRLDQSILPVGLTPDVYVGVAHEALAAGAFVYLRSDGKVANASGVAGGNQAVGFVLEASAANDPARVYFEGRNTVLTGLTPGARVYLSDSAPGGTTHTPVAGAGKVHQFLGCAVEATCLAFEGADSIILA